MKKYYIYKHTNKINGKVYIGQTYQNPYRRQGNGLSQYRHNEHFISSIKKYGQDNFEHEILLSNLTEEEMKFQEDYYIEFYDARNPEKGYNINKGGEISPLALLQKNDDFKLKISKEQSERMKERLKDPEERERLRQMSIDNQEKHPELRQEYSERMTERLKILQADDEYRKKMSNNMKELWQSDKREKLIAQTKENAKNNWNNPDYRKKMCKGVINIETGLFFESGAAASRQCNVNRSTITKALKSGKQGGVHPETKVPLHWRYATEGSEL